MGTDEMAAVDSLARRTVESGRDPKVQEILAYLKDR